MVAPSARRARRENIRLALSEQHSARQASVDERNPAVGEFLEWLEGVCSFFSVVDALPEFVLPTPGADEQEVSIAVSVVDDEPEVTVDTEPGASESTWLRAVASTTPNRPEIKRRAVRRPRWCAARGHRLLPVPAG
jgi:hypothetical protein